MEPTQVHIQAHAKVNLSLFVEQPLENGMHPIESKMARIALFDTLEVTRLEDHELSHYAILWHDDAPKQSEIDWALNDDLAVKAHRLLEKAADRVLPIQLKLEKRIPVGGGLGGGSADAAAMLLAVSTLFDLNTDLTEIAIELGSDVPFMLDGGTCIVRGIGETIEPIAFEPIHLVLLLPTYGCHTAQVYQAFDELTGTHTTGLNALLTPACIVEPRLARDIEVVTAIVGQEIQLSGSGSTMFAICDTTEHASELARKIEEQTKLVAIATQTCQEALERT